MIIKLQNKENKITLLELLKDNYFSKDLIKKLKHNYNVYDLIDPYKEVNIVLPDEETTVEASKSKIDIIYEDEYLLVVNKEKGLSTIPSIRHYLDNLASNIKYYYDQNNIKAGMHFINRLDKDTQGLVLIAKHQYIQSLFVKKNIEITKKYLTKVKEFNHDEIIVEKPIGRYLDTNKRCIKEDGDYAKTLFKKLESFDNYDLIEATLFTGRTHQIRVHLQSLGSPIIGDKLYNNDLENDFYLCSYYLEFSHPITNEEKIIILK